MKTDPRDNSVVKTAEDLRRKYLLQGSEELTSSDSVEISGGKIRVITVDTAIWGDKRPISSGGVYNITGDIERALEKI